MSIMNQNITPDCLLGAPFTRDKLLDVDMEPTTYVCVNPYDVNPVVRDTQLQMPVPDSIVKENCSMTQQTWPLTDGHGSHGSFQRVKLEMEEFGDLSSYLLQKPLSINSVDELNTPVFDNKDAFDFDIFTTHRLSQPDEFHVKLEYDAYIGTITSSDNQFKDIIINADDMHRNENISSRIANVHLQQQPQQIYDPNVISPGSDNDSAYIKITPPCSVDTSCAVSVGSDRLCSHVSSPDGGFAHNNDGVETPDDSSSSVAISGSNSSVVVSGKRESKSPNLQLNINLRPAQNEVDLTTPAIIEEVVDLEASSCFNILDLVNNEEISYIDNEIFTSPSASSTVVLPSKEETINIISQKQCTITQKRPRKRKTYDDDDDEDYVPPIKKSTNRRRNYTDSDSESDEEVRPKGRPKGRPPKRAESVSSDCSKDSDASKYRELRDKNNEASRKSRLKRKKKEVELEQEAEELRSKNIKLKAQVEELEKMVTNFRDNLFKIMVKK